MVRHIRSFSGPSKLFWYTYRLDIYIVYTLYIHCIYICVRTPTLHDCSLALAALRAAALARSLLILWDVAEIGSSTRVLEDDIAYTRG